MKTQTSTTDPIRVDFVPADVTGLPGRIGMTFAPGKKAEGIGGRWERDLGADLARLREVYRTGALVSLVEDHELRSLGIGALSGETERAGVRLLRLPIVDAGTPTSTVALVDLVRAVLDLTSSGTNVVVHCRGGLGRTGLVVASCLVALGHDPAGAIAIVRTARPGAVETRGQAAFVARIAQEGALRGLAPRTAGPSPTLARVRGCLLGGALGDALGNPIEFDGSAEAIASRYGAAPPSGLDYAGRAEITDDTQMTLFTAEGLVRARQRLADRGISSITGSVRGALGRWYETQTRRTTTEHAGWLLEVPGLHARRAPGNTCLGALRAHSQASDAPTVDRRPNDSKGCGAVMRSAPFGIACASREEAFREARDAAVLTHGHPSGYLSAAYLAAVVFDVARGVALRDAMWVADRLLVREPDRAELEEAIAAARRVAAGGPPSAAALEGIGGGWVGEEALAIALACALTLEREDPRGVALALWRSVAHGGDSDSTGSITGNLLGAMLGIEALPPRWLEALELREVIDRVAVDLHASTVIGAELDFESYPPS